MHVPDAFEFQVLSLLDLASSADFWAMSETAYFGEVSQVSRFEICLHPAGILLSAGGSHHVSDESLYDCLSHFSSHLTCSYMDTLVAAHPFFRNVHLN